MPNVQQTPQSNQSPVQSGSSSSISTQQCSSSQPNQMVYMAGNPENHLNELFKVVEETCNINNVVPKWRERNLPDSFFRPPSASSSAAHSRESSLDASLPLNSKTKSNNQPNNPGKPPTPNTINATINNSPLTGITANSPAARNAHVTPPPGLPIIHQKAHSLPASLPHNKYKYSSSGLFNDMNGQIGIDNPVAMQQMKLTNAPNHEHYCQQSFDANKIPLNTDGWAIHYDAQTNDESYYKQKMATWDDPRAKHLGSLTQLSHSNPIMNQPQTVQQQPMAVFSSQPNINIQQVINNQQQSMHQLQTHPAHHHQLQTPPNQQTTPTINSDNFPQISQQQSHKPQQQQSQQQSQQQQMTNNTNLISTGTGCRYIYSTSGDNSGNIPVEIVSAMENMNTSNDPNQLQANPVLANPYLMELEQERKRMRQRQEKINKNPAMKSDYIPLQQASIDPFLSSSKEGADQGQPDSQDSGFVNGHPYTNISNAFQINNNNNNSSSSGNNGANLFNGKLNNFWFIWLKKLIFIFPGFTDFSFNRLNLTNISDLSYDPTFQLANLQTLDLDDLDQLINSNQTNNDFNPTINHDETMTWQV